jgi:hypothetical protein
MPTEAEIQANNDGKVTFTPEQQEKVNALIRDAQGRAAQELREKASTLETSVQSLQTQLQEATNALAAATTNKQKKDASEDVEALKAQISEMKNAGEANRVEAERLKNALQAKEVETQRSRNEVVEVKKEVAIQAAAGKVGFVDLSIVTSITKDKIKYDDSRGRFVVLNDEGHERMNSAYELMTLDEFYQELAAQKPFLVRSDARFGVGSHESSSYGAARGESYKIEELFGPKSDPAKANKLALKDKKEYMRLRGVAKTAGLIP